MKSNKTTSNAVQQDEERLDVEADDSRPVFDDDDEDEEEEEEDVVDVRVG